MRCVTPLLCLSVCPKLCRPPTASEVVGEDDRFPTFHMFILAMAVLSSAIALTSLFPYIGFMIMDVGVASSLDEAGYYSGAIGEFCAGW